VGRTHDDAIRRGLFKKLRILVFAGKNSGRFVVVYLGAFPRHSGAQKRTSEAPYGPLGHCQDGFAWQLGPGGQARSLGPKPQKLTRRTDSPGGPPVVPQRPPPRGLHG